MRLRVSPRAVRASAIPAIRLLARTWRIRTEHEERWRALLAAGRTHVFLLWHEALLPLLWHHRGQDVVIVVSEAREGQYLADLGTVLGYRLVRGSSTRGASRALLGAVRELQARDIRSRSRPTAPGGRAGSSSPAWWPRRSAAARRSSRFTPRPAGPGGYIRGTGS